MLLQWLRIATNSAFKTNFIFSYGEKFIASFFIIQIFIMPSCVISTIINKLVLMIIKIGDKL